MSPPDKSAKTTIFKKRISQVENIFSYPADFTSLAAVANGKFIVFPKSKTEKPFSQLPYHSHPYIKIKVIWL